MVLNLRADGALTTVFTTDKCVVWKALEKSIGDNSEEGSNLDMFSLEIFENIAFVMDKCADASIPNTPEEWMDSIHFPFIRCFHSLLNFGD